MKRIINIKSLIFSSLLIMTACSDNLSEGELTEYFTINKITVLENKNNINSEKLAMEVNSELKLSCEILPENATDKSLKWKSSDENILTVTDDGTLKSKGNIGTAVVTVTPSIGFGGIDASKSMTVEILSEFIDIEDFNLSGAGEIYMGEILQLNAEVTNSDATFKRFKWESSDESIATVDNNGKVKALAAGDITITVTTDDFRENPIVKTHTLKVKDAIEITNITFDDDPILKALGYGQSYKIKYTVEPENATTALIKWSSSSDDITVNSEGVLSVNTLTSASAVITAKVEKGDGTVLEKKVNVAVAEGRFDFFFGNTIEPWFFDAGKGSSVADGKKSTVTMYDAGSGKYRADIRLVYKKDLYIDAKNYPILAVKITPPDNWSAGNNQNGTIKLEILDGDSGGASTFGGNYKGDTGSDNNAFTLLNPESIIPGKESVLYFDLRKNFTKAKIPQTGSVKVRQLRFVIADNKKIKTYDIYWVKSFDSVESLQEFVNTEIK